MANQSELILNLRTVMDISDVKHNADQIQQFFGKLKLSDSMTKDTKKIFSDLEKAVASYQAKMQAKPKKGSTAGLEKDAQNIIKLFGQLETKIGKISMSDLKKSFKFDDAEIVRLNKELEETKRKLSEATSGIGKGFQSTGITQGLEAIKKGLNGVDESVQNTVKKSTALRNVFGRIGAGDLDGALKSLQSFENKINTLPQDAKGIDQVKNYINQMRSSIQQAAQGGDIQVLSERIREIQTSIDTGESQFFKDLATDVQNAGTATGKCGKEIGDFSDRLVSARQSQAQLNSEMEQMKSRITYFFGINNAIQILRRGLQSTIQTMTDLDKVMTNTAVVTNYSVSDMWGQLPEYTERARKFGLAITDVYQADTLFYQQGLKTQEVQELSNETMKMARIAGLETAEATDRMTNALRGFNMELNQTNAQNVADVYSQLAAISASDVDELSVAMTKTASIASNAGASFENTAAFIAQIVETTRESAETAGTALKTIIARFTELKKDPAEIGEVDGEVVDANKIETALRSVGVALRDTDGQFRDFDDVILELSSKWDSLDTNTQRYIATIAAGSRQQSRFIALMSNNARLTQLTVEANNAAGASQKQYEKTADSLETKMNNLKTASQEFLLGIANSDIIKKGIDVLTGLLNILNSFTSGWDSASNAILKAFSGITLFFGAKKILDPLLTSITSKFMTGGQRAAQSFATGFAQGTQKNSESFFRKGMIFGRNEEKGSLFFNKKTPEGLNDELSELTRRRRAGELTSAQYAEQSYGIAQKYGKNEKQSQAIVQGLGKAESKYIEKNGAIGEKKEQLHVEGLEAHQQAIDSAKIAQEKNTEAIIANTKQLKTDTDQEADTAKDLTNEQQEQPQIQDQTNDSSLQTQKAELEAQRAAAINSAQQEADYKRSISGAEEQEAIERELQEKIQSIDQEFDTMVRNLKETNKDLTQTSSKTAKEKAPANEHIEQKNGLEDGKAAQATKEFSDAVNDGTDSVKVNAEAIDEGTKSTEQGTKATKTDTEAENQSAQANQQETTASIDAAEADVREATSSSAAGGGGTFKMSGMLKSALTGVAMMAAMYISTAITSAISESIEGMQTVEKTVSQLSDASRAASDNLSVISNTLTSFEDFESNLTSLQDDLSKCAQGTAEWSSAAMQLRGEINSILQQYPDLIKYTYEVNGVTTLTIEGREEYKRMLNEEAIALQKQSLLLKSGQTSAQKESYIINAFDTDRLNEAEKKVISDYAGTGGSLGGFAGVGAGAAVAGALGGTKLGTMLGSAAGPLGMILGAAVGALIGSGIGALTGYIQEQAFDVDDESRQAIVKKAAEQGFNASQANNEEIEKFVESVGLSAGETASLTEYIKENRDAFDTSTQSVIKANQEFRNLSIQIGELAAQEEKLVGGEAERYKELYADNREEEELNKLVTKQREYLEDKFGEQDTKEFEFDEDNVELYKMYAEAQGYTLDLSNSKAPFLDKQGKAIDIEKITDYSIQEVVAKWLAEKEVKQSTDNTIGEIEEQIRKDKNSVYNKLAARMNAIGEEWVYDLTKSQIEGLNSQLNQVSLQGGDESAYSEAIKALIENAQAQGMELVDVLNIVSKQSVETKSDFWALKDSLEQAADAQNILGFEIEDTLIEAAIDAADAIGNIDLKKLSEGAETIKELVDKIATSTDKVVTDEELKRLRGLGLRNSQYQIRDDDSAVITDPNWQFGLMRNLEKQSIEDIESKYGKNEDLSNYVRIASSQSKSKGSKRIGWQEYSLQTNKLFNKETNASNNKQANNLLQERKDKLLSSNGGYQEDWDDEYKYMVTTGLGREILWQQAVDNQVANFSMLGDKTQEDIDNFRKEIGDISSVTSEEIEEVMNTNFSEANPATARQLAIKRVQQFTNAIWNGTQSAWVNKETKDDLKQKFDEESKRIYSELEKLDLYENFEGTLEDFYKKGIENFSQESVQKLIKDNWKIEVPLDQVYTQFNKLYESGTQEALEEAIKIAKNDTEFQSLLEGSWLGQEALNYSIERDDDIEKIYSDKAIDSIDTMVYSIEGATAQMAIYASQVTASSNTIKAFTIENYKSAKSVDALISDLDEFTDDLSNPGTFEYAKAVEEISQSIVNMGWAKNLSEASYFFSTYKNEFAEIRDGGEGAQQAFNKISKQAAQAKAKAEGLDQKWVDLINNENIFEIKLGEVKDLSKEGFIEDLLSTDSEENLRKLTQLADFLQTAGFTFTFNTEEDEALLSRISADGTGINGEDEPRWVNTYDKYHNLLQDINAELRERKKLERDINRLVNLRPSGNVAEDLSVTKVTNTVQSQIRSVNQSWSMNNALLAGRKKQLREYIGETNAKGQTYEPAKEYTKYATWDEGTNTVRINWDALNAKSNVWKEQYGQEFEEWVSKLQEYSDEVSDLEETMADEKEMIEELMAFGREEYMELEKKLYDAVIQREEELIQGMQDVSNSIENANSEMLRGLQKSINKLRQDRQNQETERDISDKEQQLVYLSSSTTSDPLEIMKLEEEIADARQSYTDQLIDQKITELEDQNEQAKTQREKQISIAQAQLDYNKENGIYWKNVSDIMSRGFDEKGIKPGSDMEQLLKASANWSSMSEEQKKTFIGENTTLAAAAQTWILGALNEKDGLNENVESIDDGKDDIVEGFTNMGSMIDYEKFARAVAAGISGDYSKLQNVTMSDKSIRVDSTKGAVSSSGQDISSQISAGQHYEFKGYLDNNNNGKLDNEDDVRFQYVDGKGDKKWGFISAANVTGSTQSIEEIQKQENELANSTNEKENHPFNYFTKNNALVGHSFNIESDKVKKWWPVGWTSTAASLANGVKEMSDGGDSGLYKGETFTISQAMTDSLGSTWIKDKTKGEYWISIVNKDIDGNLRRQYQNEVNQYGSDLTKFPAFKTGGLADFTGPAWLDGTKSAPEIVLNAQDTKNFLQLRDILSDLFKGGNFERSGSSGDNYYDIDINVDEISNDYDVDQLAARIKQQIVSDSMYRNVNAINFMR